MINIVVDLIVMKVHNDLRFGLSWSFLVMRRAFGLLLVVLQFGMRTIFLIMAIFLAFPIIEHRIGLHLSQNTIHGHMLYVVLQL